VQPSDLSLLVLIRVIIGLEREIVKKLKNWRRLKRNRKKVKLLFSSLNFA
jgi:hypothetical protein